MKITDIHIKPRQVPVATVPKPEKKPKIAPASTYASQGGPAPFKSTALLEWNAQEYSFRKKEKSWFISLGILTAAFLIVAILAESLMFGIFIVIAGATIGLLAKQKPRVLHFALMPTGVKIHKTMYPYETLKSFWIFYEPDLFIKELSIESQKWLMPHITIPLGNADPNKTRETLLRFLPEKRREQSIFDAIARWLKF